MSVDPNTLDPRREAEAALAAALAAHDDWKAKWEEANGYMLPDGEMAEAARALLAERPAPTPADREALPDGVVATFSWECPTCHEWEHGYENPQLAAQELFEHEGERHD